ncbi:MAG: 16S rRNA (uracil(1498)-N(3))-methyltransferase [Myxococcales bacterium]|nr:16S rRNA (uracil(1498)-N(3))-methyltransferase [Myxococcales bacterium]MDH3486164.1 16S rRNA (uracil(1498)-N(3))-methyltransferase [Myxococcales bacterium]
MTARRLYAPLLPDAGGMVSLSEAPSRHVHVLRLKVGDQVVLFDGRGREASARIRTIGEDEVVCQAEPPSKAEPGGTRLVLMLAVPKGSKVDDCVRMATELGVHEVALMQTERTVARWDPERAKSRVDRLTRIASEAAAQSERRDVPVIHPPKPCRAWLDQVPHSALGVAFAARARARLDALTELPEQIWCAIGPEGGFTVPELEAFRGAGFAIVGLGDLVLRVETAVPAAMALVRDRVAHLVQAR